MPSGRAQGRSPADPAPLGGPPGVNRGRGGLKFSANLSWLYKELPFLDRFEAAARDGFSAVECMFHYEHAPERIAERLRAAGQQMVLVNAPAGDWAAGERGLACLPGREADFRAAIATGLRYARTLACPRLHVLAGLGTDSDCYVANLQWAAAQAPDITFCIEPINTRNFPGYFLTRQAQALDVIAAIDAPNVRLQFDAFHCQMMGEEVAPSLRRAIERNALGHVQIASAPERHEPEDTAWLPLLDELGYEGFVGCEYIPRAGTSEGLSWMLPYLSASTG